MNDNTHWYEADKGEVYSSVISHVSEIERVHADHFDRFVKLAYLYDPSDRTHVGVQEGPTSQVQENVIASNVDSVHAIVASTEIGIRIQVKDGEWSDRRRARLLEWYSEDLSKKLELDEKCADTFKAGALKGTGLIKVYTDQWDRIVAERVMVDDIIVDDSASRSGDTTQMHQRSITAAEQLIAIYPDKEEDILAAQAGGLESRAYWADYRPVDRDEVVVIESWKLPVGVKGMKGYKPGRNTIAISTCDLSDKEYEDDDFPFAVFRWGKRVYGWYGIGLAERISGHQRAINKLGWQIDRQLDQMALPTTYVRLVDASMAVRTTNRLGTISTYKGELPHTVIPKAVSPETYGREEKLYQRSYKLSGVSEMSATSMKPGGLDSGAAIREYRDVTTQRFAPQEKGYERLKLRCVYLMLRCAKRLGSKAPTTVRQDRQKSRKLVWSDVDMGEVQFQISAASNLGKTSAGRAQQAMEWAQAGVISQDEARALIEIPDTDHAISLYTSAYRSLERSIEEVLDGDLLVPEPFQNLKLGIWKFQQAYLKAENEGAPEEVLEGLRQWIVQAGFILNPPAPPMAEGPMGTEPVAASGEPMMDEAIEGGQLPAQMATPELPPLQ